MFSKQRKSHLHMDPKLRYRIVEEAQLLAEERWIIDALKKIKAQRNGLQIERLHLESVRSKIVSDSNKNHIKNGSDPKKTIEEELPDYLENMTTQTSTSKSINVAPYHNMDYNELCNTEELNLTVTNSIFDNHYGAGCDEEEDEEDMENCLIDMDLLMSGK